MSLPRRLVALVVLMAVTAAPAVLWSLTVWPGTVSVAVYGLMVALPAMLLRGWTVAVPLWLAVSLTGPLAVICSQWPAAGALLVVVAALLTGWSSTRGLHTTVMMWPIALGSLLVEPPPLFGSSQPTLDLGYAAGVGAVLAASGLWGIVVGALIGRRLTRPQRSSTAAPLAAAYTVVLVAASGLSTWLVLRYGPGGTGAWVILTVIVVLRPSPDELVRRSLQRAAGTLVGAAVAAAAVLVLPAGAVVMVAGLLAFALALALMPTAPYWQYAAILTVAVVLMVSGGHDGLEVDLERVLYTLGGVLLVAVFSVVLAIAVRPPGRTTAGARKR